MQTRWLAAILALMASICLIGAGNQSDAYLVTVHLETGEEDSPKFASPAKLGSESEQFYFKKLPEIKDDDIAWYYPFVARDGKSFGAAFKLKQNRIPQLKAITLKNQGKLLGIRIPNAPYRAVLIDRPIDDGVFVYWEGLSKPHLKAFGKKFPHIEQTSEAPPGSAPGGVDPRAVSLPPAVR